MKFAGPRFAYTVCMQQGCELDRSGWIERPRSIVWSIACRVYANVHNPGQTATECMLHRAPQASERGAPVEKLQVDELALICKAGGCSLGTCTRWQNDQHFFKLTHSHVI